MPMQQAPVLAELPTPSLRVSAELRSLGKAQNYVPTACQPLPLPSPIRLLLIDDHPLFLRGLALTLSANPDMVVVGQAAGGAEAISLYQRLDPPPDIILVDLNMPDMSGLKVIQTISQFRGRPTATRKPVQAIVLSVQNTDEQLLDAVKAGAVAYFSKRTATEELTRLIRQVAQAGPGEEVASYPISEQVYARPVLAEHVLSEFRRLCVSRSYFSSPSAASMFFDELKSSRSKSSSSSSSSWRLQTQPQTTSGGGDTDTTEEEEVWEMGEMATRRPHLNKSEWGVLNGLAQGHSSQELALSLSISNHTLKNHIGSILSKLQVQNRTQAVLTAYRQGWISI